MSEVAERARLLAGLLLCPGDGKYVLVVQQGIPHQLFCDKNINFVPSTICQQLCQDSLVLFTDEDAGGSWVLAHHHNSESQGTLELARWLPKAFQL